MPQGLRHGQENNGIVISFRLCIPPQMPLGSQLRTPSVCSLIQSHNALRGWWQCWAFHVQETNKQSAPSRSEPTGSKHDHSAVSYQCFLHFKQAAAVLHRRKEIRKGQPILATYTAVANHTSAKPNSTVLRDEIETTTMVASYREPGVIPRVAHKIPPSLCGRISDGSIFVILR